MIPFTVDEYNGLINALVTFEREVPAFKEALLDKLFRARDLQAQRERVNGAPRA